METFLATMGQVAVRLVEMHGIDAHALVRDAGIDPAMLRDPSARVSSDIVDRVMVSAAALISDPGFALRAARCWHPSNLGALGHAWLTSSTLRTGLQRLERFTRILGERARFNLTNGRDGLRLAYDHRRRDPVLQAMWADFALSVVLDMCRMNYGASLRPVEVRLCRNRPANAEPWKNFYGCPVHFDDRENSFLLSPRVAGETLPSANRQLAGTLDSILEGQLATLDRNNIPARCKATLLDQLTSGEISEDGMAKTLHMSRRTLQRKLAEAELSYQKLVDDTRHELALRYLEDPQKSATEVTFLLGFSGQSAFSRAFRRWTGISPTEYRAKKLSQAA
jgi:AraC-like DNA-binding protein